MDKTVLDVKINLPLLDMNNYDIKILFLIFAWFLFPYLLSDNPKLYWVFLLYQHIY